MIPGSANAGAVPDLCPRAAEYAFHVCRSRVAPDLCRKGCRVTHMSPTHGTGPMPRGQPSNTHGFLRWFQMTSNVLPL